MGLPSLLSIALGVVEVEVAEVPCAIRLVRRSIPERSVALQISDWAVEGVKG